MNNFAYKGYTGTIETSSDDDCLHGQILFIQDLITYEGDTVPETRKAFEEAVDRYLAYCEKTGKPANKPFSGTFNVRVGQDVHRKAAELAHHRGITLNDYVVQALLAAISTNDAMKVEQNLGRKMFAQSVPQKPTQRQSKG